MALERRFGTGLLLVGLIACGGDKAPPTDPGDGGPDPDVAGPPLEVPDSVLLPGDTMTVVVRQLDAAGHLVGRGGSAVALTVDGGTSTADLGDVRDLGDGTYRAVLTAQTSGTTSQIRATVNGTPIPVTAPLRIAAFETISAGGEYTCATLTGGIGLCWGKGDLGQLGDGSKDGSRLPRRVTGGLRFTALQAGRLGQTCGLTTGGTAYCWGNSGAGALGNGMPDTEWGTSVPSPSLVAGGHVFTRLAVGDGLAACGLTSDGAVLCWGRNDFGTLGDGTLISRNVPTPVSGNPTFVQIGMGHTHTCGATAAGTILCWGSNGWAELGVDPTSVPLACNANLCSTVPVVAAAGPPLDLDPSSLAVGTHNCVLTTAGAAYCWGIGHAGQLGDGTLTFITITPVAVAGGLQFTQLAAGNGYTCGITVDRSAYCWGAAGRGVLGNEDGAAVMPRAVSGGLHFVSLDTGAGHTCGVATDGWAYCWGDNSWGQLGDGSMVDAHPTPVRVVARLR